MSNQQNNDGNPKLTNEQKQQMKKYAVFALMFVVFGVCLWLIFAPSEEDKAKEEAKAGYNSEIPMPKEEGIIGDKKSAYEQDQIKQRQADRMRSLNDFSQLLSEETGKPSTGLTLIGEEPDEPKASSGGNKANPIQNSVSAYRDINRNLGSFYETPREDPEKKRLAEELEELKARLDEKDNRQNAVDEQMVLMEKSFQMASKYMPQTTQQGQSPFPVQNTEEQVIVANAQSTRSNTSGKTAVTPISQVRERTVSALQQNLPDKDFMEAYSKPRNLGFINATAEAQAQIKNTITACIHDDQTILDGQSVRLRLLEAMNAGNIQIPRNTIITGMGKVQGERLGISIVSLEYEGAIIPVQISIYDTDGQQGIFIPGSMEMNAAKEIAANMGTSAGTSISLTSDAGEQFAADMGRNLIQGASQFFSKKMREVKVNLKAGYKVFLLPNDK